MIIYLFHVSSQNERKPADSNHIILDPISMVHLTKWLNNCYSTITESNDLLNKWKESATVHWIH